MEFMVMFQALCLGIVEGLTEFIPVSSTGHLILLIDLMGFKGPEGQVFEIAIQLGAILAVCFIYKDKICELLRTWRQPDSQHFMRNIVLGFLPAAVIGVFAHGFIKEVLFSPLVVSVMLIVGGVIILWVERMDITPKHTRVEGFSIKLALAIGLMQCLAMIPGTSRSGATIIGALLLKVERKAAVEFSFFLAIPTMFGATAYDLFKNRDYLTVDSVSVIAIGFVAAFVAAALVVRQLVDFVSRHGFQPFGYYRIVLGSLMLFLLLS